MTEFNTATGHETENVISFATLPDHIVVIRVAGRGSFHNSMELRKIADAMVARSDGNSTRFIIDLKECVTMDSTFMGVLASIGLNQLKTLGDKTVVVNANSQNLRLLSTLGLTQFMNVRQSPEGGPSLANSSFQAMDKTAVSRAEHIVHMIEAHKDLCEIDPENNLRFENVLKYLQDSLDRDDDLA